MSNKQQSVAVLDGFKPGTELTATQADTLENLSKYGRIPTDRDAELAPYVRLVEGAPEDGVGGQDIVAIFDKRTGLVGVVHRVMTEAIALSGNRTARKYDIVGFKPCARDEALEMVWAPQRAAAIEALGDLAPTSEEPF